MPQSLQFPLLRAMRKKSVMHYLGSDIRGKAPAELAYGKKAGAQVIGSYDAIRWVPEAEVIPPGIDVAAIRPAPPSDRARPLIVHAPSSRRRKGTEHVVAACEGLDADLELVEGLHHDEAFERYRAADIVVDQLNAGWYGVFAIEAMSLGKPVVTFLHEEAVRRTEEAFGTKSRSSPPPRRPCAKPFARSSPTPRADASSAPPREPTSSACTTWNASPTACSTSTLGSDGCRLLAAQLARLGKHSAIYGLGGIVSRVIAVFLLPVYTRFLDTDEFGSVGVLVALSAVLVTILRAGISSAFFRFTFDSKDPARRLLVLRTSFWFTMASATLGLAAGVRSRSRSQTR